MAGPTVSGKKRLFVALGGIAFIFILLIIRLFWIQIIDGKRLSEMAQEQQTQDTSLSAARGTITDTNGEASSFCSTLISSAASRKTCRE